MIKQDIKKFISEYWSYDINKLKQDTTLDDIGMYGADKYDFLIAFSQKFSVNMKNFQYKRYIDDEGDFFSIGKIIKKIIFNEDNRKIECIRISMLIDWAERKSV